MPKTWYDYHSAKQIEDPQKRAFYLSILADRKPLFMTEIYPMLRKEYKNYEAMSDANCHTRFGIKKADLLAMNPDDMTEDQRTFIQAYMHKMPVGIGDCAMNRIFGRIGEQLDNLIKGDALDTGFDYSILKSGAEYTRRQYDAVVKIFKEYQEELRQDAIETKKKRLSADPYKTINQTNNRSSAFAEKCLSVTSNMSQLCDILIDVCYKRDGTKQFVWELCGKDICRNLLQRSEGMFYYPTASDDGEIIYSGSRFTMAETRSVFYE